MNSQVGVLPRTRAEPRIIFKVRVRFHKTAALRFIGHQDLVRLFERACRRSQIPVASTLGFHPKLRLVFALSLPLGVVGRNEIVEIDLTSPPDCLTLHKQLQEQIGPGMDILSVEPSPGKHAPKVISLFYKFPFSRELLALIALRVEAIQSTPHSPCPVFREGKKYWDIRPFIRFLQIDEGALVAGLWFTPEGTAKPMEIFSLLGLEGPLPPETVIERLGLELEEEHNSLKGMVLE
ncbi:MAG: DUF2344 domain-containing protein [Gemmataceae bacterium]|nr:DUF2344 domain-containing protein [Gemmataceae bacterium]